MSKMLETKISPDIENGDLYKRFVDAGYRLVKEGEGCSVYLGEGFLIFTCGRGDIGLQKTLEVEYCAWDQNVYLLGILDTLKEAKGRAGEGIVTYINENENPVYPGEEGYGK